MKKLFVGILLLLALVLGWTYLQKQNALVVIKKMEEFCRSLEGGSNIHDVKSRARTFNFYSISDSTAETPGTNRTIVAAKLFSISVGPFKKSVRCVIDHQDDQVTGIQIDTVDET